MLTKKQTGVIVFVVAALLVALYFPLKYRKTEPAADKLKEIQKLALGNKCEEALKKAGSVVKTNSRAPEIWQMKGVCEFDLGRFSEAEESFNKVLALDPEHAAAKNYLKSIEQGKSATMITGLELPFEHDEYERVSGLQFDSKILQFEKVVKRPSNIPLYLLATYTRSGSEESVVEYIKEFLEKSGQRVSVSNNDTGTMVAAGSDSQIVFVALAKGSTTVSVNVQLLK